MLEQKAKVLLKPGSLMEDSSSTHSHSHFQDSTKKITTTTTTIDFLISLVSFLSLKNKYKLTKEKEKQQSHFSPKKCVLVVQKSSTSPYFLPVPTTCTTLGVFLFLIFITGNPLMTTIRSAEAFNVDVSSIISHRGPGGSMFGFSIAQHRDSNVSWILVGAPNGDGRQPGVSNGGAVFRCSCEANDNCQLIPFDRTGNNLVQNQQIDNKTGQWFGATVKSSGEDGIVLACAPRYTWFTSNRKRRDPVGTCFVAKDSFTEFVEYSPCRTAKWGYHRQGSCQVGLGADVDPAGRRIFLGAVGSWYWQGQMYMIDSRKAAPGSARAPFYQFLPPGQAFSQSSSIRPDIRWTMEGPSWDDDSYLGYSVVSGEFNGDSDSDVAVGMPRGANLTGKVVVYSSDLVNLHNITGEQIGAYFGYSLTVLDVDGDGFDDIVIGAPMYTDYHDTAMKIETGRVYVVYQNKKHKFKRWDSLDGTAHRGRFGLSLCSLGDINRDGIDDFAVGAPYDGLYGRGAVYIFQGTKAGVRKEFTQVIYGSSLQQTVSTFGFSLAGGRDLDGNGYPDLLVGAYESDIVTYFRSRPVVVVRSKLTFTSGKQINLDEKRCTLRDGSRVACLPLSLCMSYDGFGADDVIDFNVQYILDSKKTKEPRMFFLNNEGSHTVNSTVRLRKTAEQCTNTQVYIRPQIRDKLTSLEAEIKYSMIERGQRRLAPVIDVTASTTEKDSVSIRKDCGSDNVCIPDLRLKVSASDASFVMGSTQRVWIEVEVENKGEDSFESMLYVQVPQGLSYVSFDRLDTRKDVPILCSPPTPLTNNTLKCDIGNPLPAFAHAKFKLFFQPKPGSDVRRAYEFFVTANSTNPEEIYQTSDNVGYLTMGIEVETSVEVYGTVKPQPVLYNSSLYEGKEERNETDIGPEVIHVYEIKCTGPSHIEETSVVILWPSFTKDGNRLLYLLEEPTIEGPGTCDPVGDVNPNKLKIQKHTKFTSHTSETVTEGEGRQRNFTQSSEYITEGGTYTQRYSNTSYETRRTSKVVSGGGGSSGTYGAERNRIAIPVSSSEEIGERKDYYGRSGTGHGSSITSIPSTTTIQSYDRPYGGGSGVGGYESTETSYRGGLHSSSVNVGHGQSRGGGQDYHSGGGGLQIGGDYYSGGSSNRGGSITSTRQDLNGRSGSGSRDHSHIEQDYYGGSDFGIGERNHQGGSRGGITTSSSSHFGESDPRYSSSSSQNQGQLGHRDTTTAFNNQGSISSTGGGSGSYSRGSSGTGTYTHRTHTHETSFSRNNNNNFGDDNDYDYIGSIPKQNGRDHVSFSNRPVENYIPPSRHKRALTKAFDPSAYEKELQCQDVQCIPIRCKIGPLTSNSSAIFYLRGRVYSKTIQSKFPGDPVKISSKILARVTQLPYNVDPDYLPFKKLELVTTVEEEPDLSEQHGVIPWWIYALGILLGIILLLILIYLLKKCGFFKRRRPNPSPEGQPLHRNGYRDERL